MAVPDELMRKLRTFQQEHLLGGWEQLSPEARRTLEGELSALDLPLVQRLFQEQQGGEDYAELARRAQSPPAVCREGERPYSADEARRRSRQALDAGELGVVLVAGGQGTRLGFDRPKGMFPIGLVSGATLFEILIHKVRALAARHGVRIPLYLMTSPATHDDTVAYLDEQQRFGLPAEDLRIFCQGTMPAIDASTGRVLLAEPGRIALSPDGHGGMLAALARTGQFDDMRRRGLRQLFYLQVDNPLAPIGDAEFLGYHLLSGSEMSTLAVRKRTPTDKVGNIVSIDGQVRIIEYSDLPQQVAEQRRDDGSLALWAGNTAIHILDVAFLERMSAGAGRLPFHIARKRVPHVDASGRAVEPASANAIKFERFIFDLLPEARQAVVVEADEAAHFAPVKNAPGEPRDTPDAVRAQMQALFHRWLRGAGALVADDVAVEISPLFALDEEEARAKVSPGAHFAQSQILR